MGRTSYTPAVVEMVPRPVAEALSVVRIEETAWES